MPLQSYSDLLDSINRWIDGADVTASAPDFVALAEADFRRQLTVPDQDVTAALVSTNPYTLPPDLDSIRALVWAGDPRHALQPVPIADLDDLPQYAVGDPQFYAVDGNSFTVWPAPQAATTFMLSYRAVLSALSNDNPSNWLLAQHPDAYLFGSLLQAEFFGWNDDRLPLIQTKLGAIISDINTAGQRKRYGGRLAMRPSVDERLYLARGA